MISSTKDRFSRFNKLKGEETLKGQFWDIVVITAADDAQKEVYETQLKEKLSKRLLPVSAEYIVVSDPPGYKIGNGGSTMVVLEALHQKYGDAMIKKKTLIIHAGGLSQRFPSGSIMGKVFVAVPTGEPVFQMLDVKLASYIDFPSKIDKGGIFVSCADTLEVYNDGEVNWTFADTGFTALAHPSPLNIGTTHGVFVLDEAPDCGDDNHQNTINRHCKKFLHKPSVMRMRETAGCVRKISPGACDAEEIVYTDSAFFISGGECLKLLNFYKENKPLTCEIDAYGDFMQSLGTEASSDYVKNTVNVVSATGSLLEIREKVFKLLRGTPLHVVALVPQAWMKSNCNATISSHFYHFGTTAEYLELLTGDRRLIEMLSFEPMTYCLGLPFTFKAQHKPLSEASVPDVNQHVTSLPRVMASVIFSGVTIGERSVLEYCRLRECVTIGDNCIISNCSLPQHANIPSNIFLHTVAINSTQLGCDFSVGYVTVAFDVRDNLKQSACKEKAGTAIKYLGKSLEDIFSDTEDAFPCQNDQDVVRLWDAKLFSVYQSMEESSSWTCRKLKTYLDSKTTCLVKNSNQVLVSMADSVKHKDVQQMLQYRRQLEKEINPTNYSHSFHE